ncbi:MAG: glycogen/starch synthase, partial [Candidatus Omnitrophica bacterium]|nr:glycogen/starch synthase [Candidatus Omnitrophota bacterium]
FRQLSADLKVKPVAYQEPFGRESLIVSFLKKLSAKPHKLSYERLSLPQKQDKNPGKMKFGPIESRLTLNQTVINEGPFTIFSSCYDYASASKLNIIYKYQDISEINEKAILDMVELLVKLEAKGWDFNISYDQEYNRKRSGLGLAFEAVQDKSAVELMVERRAKSNGGLIWNALSAESSLAMIFNSLKPVFIIRNPEKEYLAYQLFKLLAFLDEAKILHSYHFELLVRHLADDNSFYAFISLDNGNYLKLGSGLSADVNTGELNGLNNLAFLAEECKNYTNAQNDPADNGLQPISFREIKPTAAVWNDSCVTRLTDEEFQMAAAKNKNRNPVNIERDGGKNYLNKENSGRIKKGTSTVAGDAFSSSNLLYARRDGGNRQVTFEEFERGQIGRKATIQLKISVDETPELLLPAEFMVIPGESRNVLKIYGSAPRPGRFASISRYDLQNTAEFKYQRLIRIRVAPVPVYKRGEVLRALVHIYRERFDNAKTVKAAAENDIIIVHWDDTEFGKENPKFNRWQFVRSGRGGSLKLDDLPVTPSGMLDLRKILEFAKHRELRGMKSILAQINRESKWQQWQAALYTPASWPNVWKLLLEKEGWDEVHQREYWGLRRDIATIISSSRAGDRNIEEYRIQHRLRWFKPVQILRNALSSRKTVNAVKLHKQASRTGRLTAKQYKRIKSLDFEQTGLEMFNASSAEDPNGFDGGKLVIGKEQAIRQEIGLGSIKAALFDIGGVLLDCSKEKKIGEIREFIEKLFSIELTCAEVETMFYSGEDALALRTDLYLEDFLDRINAQLRARSGKQGLSFTSSDFVKIFFLDCEVSQEMKTLVEDLRGQGAQMYILSNFFISRRVELSCLMLGILAQHFPGCFTKENVFFSNAVGYAKPSEEAYAAVLRHIDARPEEILYVDDQQENAFRAYRMGLNSCWFYENFTRKTIGSKSAVYLSHGSSYTLSNNWAKGEEILVNIYTDNSGKEYPIEAVSCNDPGKRTRFAQIWNWDGRLIEVFNEYLSLGKYNEIFSGNRLLIRNICLDSTGALRFGTDFRGRFPKYRGQEVEVNTDNRFVREVKFISDGKTIEFKLVIDTISGNVVHSYYDSLFLGRVEKLRDFTVSNISTDRRGGLRFACQSFANLFPDFPGFKADIHVRKGYGNKPVVDTVWIRSSDGKIVATKKFNLIYDVDNNLIDSFASHLDSARLRKMTGNKIEMRNPLPASGQLKIGGVTLRKFTTKAGQVYTLFIKAGKLDMVGFEDGDIYAFDPVSGKVLSDRKKKELSDKLYESVWSQLSNWEKSLLGIFAYRVNGDFSARSIASRSNLGYLICKNEGRNSLSYLREKLQKTDSRFVVTKGNTFFINQGLLVFVKRKIIDPASAEARNKEGLKKKINRAAQEIGLPYKNGNRRHFSKENFIRIYPQIVIDYEALRAKHQVNIGWTSLVEAVVLKKNSSAAAVAAIQQSNTEAFSGVRTISPEELMVVLESIKGEHWSNAPPSVGSLPVYYRVAPIENTASNNDGGKDIPPATNNVFTPSQAFIDIWKDLANNGFLNNILALSIRKPWLDREAELKKLLAEAVNHLDIEGSFPLKERLVYSPSATYFEDEKVILFYDLYNIPVMVRVAPDHFADYLTDTEYLLSFFGPGLRVDILWQSEEMEYIRKDLEFYKANPEFYRFVYQLNSPDAAKVLKAFQGLVMKLAVPELKDEAVRLLNTCLGSENVLIQRMAQKVLNKIYTSRPVFFPEASETIIVKMGKDIRINDFVFYPGFNPFKDISRLSQFQARLVAANNYSNELKYVNLQVSAYSDDAVLLRLNDRERFIPVERGIVHLALQVRYTHGMDWVYVPDSEANVAVFCQKDLSGKVFRQIWAAYNGIYDEEGQVRRDENGKVIPGTFKDIQGILPQLKKEGVDYIYVMGICQLDKPENIPGQEGPDASLFSIFKFSISEELGGKAGLVNLINEAEKLGIQIYAGDLMPHVNQNCRDLPEWAFVKARNQYDRNKIIRRLATDGSINHENGLPVEWHDSVILNFRDKRVIAKLAFFVEYLAGMGIKGMRIDVAHNFGAMLPVDKSPYLQSKEKLFGRITSWERNSSGGFKIINNWDSSEANPFLLYLVSEITRKYPEFIFLGENYGTITEAGPVNKYIQVIKSGVIPFDSGTHDDLESVIIKGSPVSGVLNPHFRWLFSELPQGSQWVAALETHDYFRNMDQWESFGPQKIKAAVWCWLATTRGPLMLYNRQELGEVHRVRIDNFTQHDYAEADRQRYYAQLEFGRVHKETIQHFWNKAIGFYKAHACISCGQDYIFDTGNDRVFAIARYNDNEKIIFIVNMGWETVSLKIDLNALWDKLGIENSRLKFYSLKEFESGTEEAFTGEELRAYNINARLEGYESAVISLKTDGGEDIHLIALRDALCRYSDESREVRTKYNYAFVTLAKAILKGNSASFYEAFSYLAELVEGELRFSDFSCGDLTLIMHEISVANPGKIDTTIKLLKDIRQGDFSEDSKAVAGKVLRWMDIGSAVFVSPEAAPVSKAGGMANVVGELAEVLAGSGLKVYVISPLYKYTENSGKIVEVKERTLSKFNLRYTGKPIDVYVGRHGLVRSGLAHARISKVDHLLLDNPYFADSLYGQLGGYRQDPNSRVSKEHESLRAIFLSLGALEAMKAMNIYPSIVIGNDWMCAPLMVHLNSIRSLYKNDPHFVNTRTIGWVHNNGQDYQFKVGRFENGIDLLGNLGLPSEDYGWFIDPHNGELINFMAAFIRHSHFVVAVSPGQMWDYLRSDEKGGGEGLCDIFRGINKERRLFAITNGIAQGQMQLISFGEDIFAIDSEIQREEYLLKVWGIKQNAKPWIAQQPIFWPATQGSSKLLNSDNFVVNMVSRITEQKGIQYVVPFAERVLNNAKYHDVMFVFAGQGDAYWMGRLNELVYRYSGRVGYSNGFVPDAVRNMAYICGDLFIAFSIWEPGGISPMEALAFGLPCLVSDRQGHMSTIIRGVNGERFSIDDQDPGRTIDNIMREFDILYDTWKSRNVSGRWIEMVKNALFSNNSWDKSVVLAENLFKYTLTAEEKYYKKFYPDEGSKFNDGGCWIEENAPELKDKLLATLSMEGNIPEFEGYDAQNANTKGGLGAYFGDKLEGLADIGMKACGCQPMYSHILKAGKRVCVDYSGLINNGVIKRVYDN